MRKFPATVFLFLLMLGLSGCSGAPDAAQPDKPCIAASVFPAYDFAREIAQDRAEVVLLVPPGAESHSYEPTPQDLRLLNRCMLLVANGGESEAWLDTVLDGLDRRPAMLTMLSCVDALEEETAEGMQSGGILSRGRIHPHDGHAHRGEHGPEYDEHVWTSPVNAMAICRAICDRLCALDPEGEASYRENCRAYTQRLAALDADFRALAENASRRTVIFADRFPVRYFVEEYGLAYYAAFPGCADDAEPSARTVAFLIDKVRKEEIPAVFYIEFSNQKMADILCEETGCKKLLFHSCHNVSAEELAGGVRYEALMRQNLENLREALG